MKTLTGSKCHFVYLSFTGMPVNNSKPTASPNLLTDRFRDYRMATNFNFIKMMKQLTQVEM
jgi:hypothetical protein